MAPLNSSDYLNGFGLSAPIDSSLRTQIAASSAGMQGVGFEPSMKWRNRVDIL